MTTDQALRELEAREPIFHRPELGTDFASMVTEGFWEIGASGRVYTREFVLAVLRKRLEEPAAEVWATSNFHCRKLAEDLFLLTYDLLQDQTRKTRRTTLWRFTADGWKIEFHQGTMVAD